MDSNSDLDMASEDPYMTRENDTPENEGMSEYHEDEDHEDEDHEDEPDMIKEDEDEDHEDEPGMIKVERRWAITGGELGGRPWLPRTTDVREHLGTIYVGLRSIDSGLSRFVLGPGTSTDPTRNLTGYVFLDHLRG